MGKTTDYECDGCGVSVPDPGTVSELGISTYGLRGGTKYLDSDYSREELDLCPSCISNVKKTIQRTLRLTVKL